MGMLAEKLEALRVKIADTHGDELYLAARLKADIAARDAELMSEIVSIIQDHDSRRRDVAQALHLLASRIGQLPRIVPPAPVQTGSVPPSLPDAAAPGHPPAPRQVTGVH